MNLYSSFGKRIELRNVIITAYLLAEISEMLLLFSPVKEQLLKKCLALPLPPIVLNSIGCLFSNWSAFVTLGSVAAVAGDRRLAHRITAVIYTINKRLSLYNNNKKTQVIDIEPNTFLDGDSCVVSAHVRRR